MARMQQFFIPFGFVTQKQQALRIRVEPANGPDVFRKTKFRERAVGRAARLRRAPARQIAGELRQHAERFIECDEHNICILATESLRTQRKMFCFTLRLCVSVADLFVSLVCFVVRFFV